MAGDWIVDVLDDLKVFAAGNGLPRLAERLDDARAIAVAEIGSRAEGAGGDAPCESGGPRRPRDGHRRC